MSQKNKKESTKTVQKKNEKIIEDKTFGLKNKKGSKQQKFIKTVTHQIANDPNQNKKLNKEKAKKDDLLEDITKIFKPVVQEQKINKGVDPKSMLCAFFKQNICGKGDKCKFSHDLACERKGEKRSMYIDARTEDETMENWDESKLEEVVSKKHSEENKSNKTDIICKHFLKALEDNKYGWFWECPDGGDKCFYKHALPPGFTLKRNIPALKENLPLLEELLDKKVTTISTHTKLNLENFRAWKAKRLKIKREKALQVAQDKEAKYKAGKLIGLSGRDIFTFDPSLGTDDIGYMMTNGVDGDSHKNNEFDSDDAVMEGIDDLDDIYDLEGLNQSEALDNEIELELSNLINMEMNKPSITNIEPGSSSKQEEIYFNNNLIEILSKKIDSTL
ncbi:unnamed protein product [Gordionus sp. m RMFG-2023]|uniref:zinc finger CCCH domain-containing protein 15-like n=1 Tax=Gordionus sp. m RMFG-2023 TaxID=3053472 RepID=UPI0030DF5467